MVLFRPILVTALSLSGLVSFAGIALSNEAASEQPAAGSTTIPSMFVSDGSVVRFDQDRASLMPISGWQVEPRGAGMALVMKEVVKQDPKAAVDYSQPLFARNISVMTMNEPSPIDEARAASFEEQYLKMATRDGAMKDLQITGHKFFNYKGENDGLVFFAQHSANGFQMMQMIILVSGDAKQYLLTYTDLASRFSNQDSYDAAWKSMTSVIVPGVAPKRYYREAQLAGAIAGGLLLLIAPFGIARFSSQRRIRRMVEELQSEWDSGEVSAASNLSNVSQLDMTRVAASSIKGKKRGSFDIDVSAVSSFSSDVISTRKRKFSMSSHA